MLITKSYAEGLSNAKKETTTLAHHNVTKSTSVQCMQWKWAQNAPKLISECLNSKNAPRPPKVGQALAAHQSVGHLSPLLQNISPPPPPPPPLIPPHLYPTLACAAGVTCMTFLAVHHDIVRCVCSRGNLCDLSGSASWYCEVSRLNKLASFPGLLHVHFWSLAIWFLHTVSDQKLEV